MEEWKDVDYDMDQVIELLGVDKREAMNVFKDIIVYLNNRIDDLERRLQEK